VKAIQAGQRIDVAAEDDGCVKDNLQPLMFSPISIARR